MSHKTSNTKGWNLYSSFNKATFLNTLLLSRYFNGVVAQQQQNKKQTDICLPSEYQNTSVLSDALLDATEWAKEQRWVTPQEDSEVAFLEGNELKTFTDTITTNDKSGYNLEDLSEPKVAVKTQKSMNCSTYKECCKKVEENESFIFHTKIGAGISNLNLALYGGLAYQMDASRDLQIKYWGFFITFLIGSVIGVKFIAEDKKVKLSLDCLPEQLQELSKVCSSNLDKKTVVPIKNVVSLSKDLKMVKVL